MKTKLSTWCYTTLGAIAAVGTILVCPFNAFGEETFQDPSSKTVFPKEVSFDIDGKKHTLQATGASSRIKFFVKVYSLANYVENPVKTSMDALVNQILNENPARQFTIHWLRGVEAEKVKSGFIEGLQKSLPAAEFNGFQDQINQYLSVYNEDIKPNDIITLRWLPDGSLHVMRGDKEKVEIKNNDFAKAVWNMSVGPNSVVKRNELFSLIFPR